jgi:hypothetical protein
MEGGTLKDLAKAAGIGGIALGVLYLIFKQVIPATGTPLLSPAQAYAILRSLMILTFGVSGLGILAWLIAPHRDMKRPIPQPTIAILGVLFIVVILAAVYAGTLPVPQADYPVTVSEVKPQNPPNTVVPPPVNICAGNGGGASCLGPGVVAYTCDEYNAIGGGGDATYNTFNKRFCNGGPETAKINVRHNFSRGGGQCGWTSFTVICAR